MPKKITTKDYIERVKAIHNDLYDYSKLEYKGMKEDVLIICPVHGEFTQKADKHLHGKTGCPKCVGNLPIDKETFLKRSKKVHGNFYDYSKVIYEGLRNKNVEIICPIHGSFWQLPYRHQKGNGCPKCANNQTKGKQTFIKEAQDIHGGFYDYSKVNYINNKTPVTIICPIHGEFNQIPYVHLTGSDCPVCGDIKRVANRDVEKFKDTWARKPMEEKREIKEKIKYTWSKKTYTEKAKITNKSFHRKKLNGTLNTSKPEETLYELLVEEFSEKDVIRQYKFNDYPFYCDFYIPSRNLYIELNAAWFHENSWYDEKKHKDLIKEWEEKSKTSKFYKNAIETFTKRDVLKRNTARENNLNYVVFWDNDLRDVKVWLSLGCPDGKDYLKEYSWL